MTLPALCPDCGMAAERKPGLRWCRYCGWYMALVRTPAISREDVQAAVERYRAQGGQITRLPAQPAPAPTLTDSFCRSFP